MSTALWTLATIGLYEAIVVVAASDSTSYKEVYPQVNISQNQFACEPSENVTCPLYVALTLSFGGDYNSGGALPGVQIAIDQINNNPSLLPGYSLHYALLDSQCNRTISLKAFNTHISQQPIKIAVIGSGCSIATEASAGVSHTYNLTQLSCVSSSPALSNREQFPYHFQLLASEAEIATGFLGIIREFGWRRVGIITQNENLFTVTTNRLKSSLDSIGVVYSERLFETSKGIESLGANPFSTMDPEARIFIIAMYPSRARHIMCMAYKNDIRYPRYLFLLIGWYGNNWWKVNEDILMSEFGCNARDLESVLLYSLAVLNDEFLEDTSIVVDSGINGSEFQSLYDEYLQRSPFNLTSLVYSQQCYDATWTLAYALNKTLQDCKESSCSAGVSTGDGSFGLQHFLYNNSIVAEKMLANLEKTNFTGITGDITFDKSSGVRRIQNLVIFSYQPCQDKNDCAIQIKKIASLDTTTNRFTYTTDNGEDDIWGPDGRPPYYEDNRVIIIAVPIAVVLFVACIILLFAVGITYILIKKKKEASKVKQLKQQCTELNETDDKAKE